MIDLKILLQTDNLFTPNLTTTTTASTVTITTTTATVTTTITTLTKWNSVRFFTHS